MHLTICLILIWKNTHTLTHSLTARGKKQHNCRLAFDCVRLWSSAKSMQCTQTMLCTLICRNGRPTITITSTKLASMAETCMHALVCQCLMSYRAFVAGVSAASTLNLKSVLSSVPIKYIYASFQFALFFLIGRWVPRFEHFFRRDALYPHRFQNFTICTNTHTQTHIHVHIGIVTLSALSVRESDGDNLLFDYSFIQYFPLTMLLLLLLLLCFPNDRT